MNIKQYFPALTLPVTAIFFLVGVAGHLFPQTRDLMTLLTPAFLLGFGLLMLVPEFNRKGVKFLLWSGVTYLVTLILEILGVKTGLVFGAYHYSGVLGAGVFDVPLVIGFNWVLVVAGAILWAEGEVRSPWGRALTAGLLCVLFDFLLEPAAIGLNYWTWDQGFIPLQNYAAWFVISFGVALFWQALKIQVQSLNLKYYLIFQVFFFLFLRIFLGF